MKSGSMNDIDVLLLQWFSIDDVMMTDLSEIIMSGIDTVWWNIVLVMQYWYHCGIVELLLVLLLVLQYWYWWMWWWWYYWIVDDTVLMLRCEIIDGYLTIPSVIMLLILVLNDCISD